MNWFLVELEIDIYGKLSEVVQAENKDDCELITLHQTSKKTANLSLYFLRRSLSS